MTPIFDTPKCLEHAYRETTRLGELRETGRIDDEQFYAVSEMLDDYIHGRTAECDCNGFNNPNGCEACTKELEDIYDEIPF